MFLPHLTPLSLQHEKSRKFSLEEEEEEEEEVVEEELTTYDEIEHNKKLETNFPFRQQYDIDNKNSLLSREKHMHVSSLSGDNFLRRQLNYEEEYGNNNNTEREEMVTQYNNNNKSNVDSSKNILLNQNSFEDISQCNQAKSDSTDSLCLEVANHNKNNNHFISGTSTPPDTMYNYNGLPMVYSSLENNNKVPRKQFNLHLQQVPPQLQVQLPQSHNIQRSLLANSSATNLNAYLRGNRRYSSSGNSNPINDLLTSPKFIKSNKFNSPIPSSTPTTTAQTSPITNGNPVIDQKNRLVDQFYNSGRTTSPGSRVDLSNMHKEALLISPTQQQSFSKVSTPKSERKFNWKEDSLEPRDELTDYSPTPPIEKNHNLDDEIMDDILNKGGFKFKYDPNQLVQDKELVNYLLNIDNILDHNETTHDIKNKKDTSLSELNKAMSNLYETTLLKSKKILTPHKNEHFDSLTELSHLERYLDELHNSIDSLGRSLGANRDKVRGSYKDEINDNITRLNQVSKELETLEAKANTFRDQISQQKANNTNQMMGTIAILTDVNNKMKKYSIIKRNRIIVEVNIVLGLLVLVVSIYYGYKNK